MAISSAAELPRRPDQPAVPAPAEIFAPFLLPCEELLWAAYPNAAAYQPHHRRGIHLAFGGVYAIVLPLVCVGYWGTGLGGWGIALLCVLPVLFIGHWCSLSQKQPELDYCFGVTSLRVLRYDAHAEESNIRGMLFSDIHTLSVETSKDGCGTICFNQSVLLFKSETCFLVIDYAEAVAALLLDAKRKAPLA